MKTDLKKLLAEINAGISSLTEDADTLSKAETSSPEAAAAVLQQQQLIGHSISGLRGVAANLNGMIGEPSKA